MIILLLYWLFMSLIISLYGFMAQKSLIYLFGFQQDNRQAFYRIFILGLIFLSGISTWFSLFYRINFEIHLLLGIGALFYAFWDRKELASEYNSLLKEAWESPLFIKIIFLCCTFTATANSCIDTEWNYDHAVYYVQYVKWIEEYGTVCGLGHLTPHLAYNSQWHLLSALFSFSYLHSSVQFNDLNGLFWLVMLSCSLRSAQQIYQKKAALSDYFAVLLPLPMYISRYYLNAAYADFAIMLIIWLQITFWAQLIEQNQWKKLQLESFLAVFFAFFTITVKLSAVMIALPSLAIVFFLFKEANVRKLLISFVLTLGLILPWLGRYYYLSGYLVFPFHQLDLFDPDWKLDEGASIYLQTEIEAFSKLANNRYAIAEVLHYPLSRWVPEWFSDLKYYDRFIIILSVLTGFALLIGGLYHLFKQQKGSMKYGLIALAIFGGLLFWFFKAPSPRFGYSWLFATLFFSAAYVLRFLYARYASLAQLFWAFLLIWSFKVAFDSLNELYYFAGMRMEFGEKLIIHREKASTAQVLELLVGLPPKTREVPLDSYVIDGQMFYIPHYRDIYNRFLCWNAPLPCCGHNHSEEIEMRGKTIGEGFRKRKK
jgi:hypothetical protein